MRPIEYLFKYKFILGVMALTRKTWLRYEVLFFGQACAAVIILLPLIFEFPNHDLVPTPTGNVNIVEFLFTTLIKLVSFAADNGYALLGGALSLILFSLFSAWQINASLKLNDIVIHNHRSGITEIMRKSFDALFLRLLVAFLLFVAVYILLIVLSLVIASYTSLQIGLFTGIGGSIFLLRFALVPAYVVHGKLAINDSIYKSFSVVTLRRMFALTLAILLLFLLMWFPAILFILIYQALMLFSITGIAIQIALQIAFIGIVFALIYCALSGLYYRWNDSTPAEDDLISHLVQQT
jgi:hypothetical protein